MICILSENSYFMLRHYLYFEWKCIVGTQEMFHDIPASCLSVWWCFILVGVVDPHAGSCKQVYCWSVWRWVWDWNRSVAPKQFYCVKSKSRKQIIVQYIFHHYARCHKMVGKVFLKKAQLNKKERKFICWELSIL